MPGLPLHHLPTSYVSTPPQPSLQHPPGLPRANDGASSRRSSVGAGPVAAAGVERGTFCGQYCLCGALLRRAARPGEPESESSRKASLLPLSAWAGTIAIGLLLRQAIDMQCINVFAQECCDTADTCRDHGLLTWSLGMAAFLVFFAGSVVILVPCICSRTLPLRNAEMGLMLFAAGTLCCDAASYLMAGQAQVWPFCVLVLDQLLVIDARRSTGLYVIGATTIWVTCRAALTQIDNYHNSDRPLWLALVFMLIVALLNSTVMVLDYWFTRNFAHGMRTREASLQGSVSTAEAVSESLGQYDTESARRVLNSADGAKIPPRLGRALLKLVVNMQQYKPYLPQSLLPGADADTIDGEAPTISESSTSNDSALSSSSSDDNTDNRIIHQGKSTSSSCSALSEMRLPPVTPVQPPPDTSPKRSHYTRPNYPGVMINTSSVHGAQAADDLRECDLRTPVNEPSGMPSGVSWRKSSSKWQLEDTTTVGLELRNVALATVNVRGFHALISAPTRDDSETVCRLHARLVELFLATVRPKGTLDSVTGDRGRASFNAVRRCGGYRGAAAACGAAASGACGSAPADFLSFAAAGGGPGAELSAGAGAGVGMVGNAGAAALRTFSVLSTLPGWVHALERVAVQGLGTACLIDEATAEEAALELCLRQVPLLVRHCKHRPDGSALRLWSVAGGRASMEGDRQHSTEWMYQVQGDAEANPFRAYNNAVDMYLSMGMTDHTRQSIRTLSCTPNGGNQLSALPRLIEELQLLASVDPARGAAPAPVVLFDAAALPGGAVVPEQSPPGPLITGGRLMTGREGTTSIEELMRQNTEAQENAQSGREADRLRQEAQLHRTMSDRKARKHKRSAQDRADCVLEQPLQACAGPAQPRGGQLRTAAGLSSVQQEQAQSPRAIGQSPIIQITSSQAAQQPLQSWSPRVAPRYAGPGKDAGETPVNILGLEEVLVQLIRDPADEDRPWGLGLEEGTMVLRHVLEGSIAAQSQKLQGCMGMIVTHVDNQAVHHLGDVERLVGQWKTNVNIRLCPTLAQALSAVGFRQFAAWEQQLLALEGIRTVADVAYIHNVSELPLSIPEELRQALAALAMRIRKGAGPDGAPAEQEADVVLRLTRHAFETWIPWGVKIDRNMILRSCVAGSLAAQSPALRECVGMRLVKVNGSSVDGFKGLQPLTEEKTDIEFVFSHSKPEKSMKSM